MLVDNRYAIAHAICWKTRTEQVSPIRGKGLTMKIPVFISTRWCHGMKPMIRLVRTLARSSFISIFPVCRRSKFVLSNTLPSRNYRDNSGLIYIVFRSTTIKYAVTAWRSIVATKIWRKKWNFSASKYFGSFPKQRVLLRFSKLHRVFIFGSIQISFVRAYTENTLKKTSARIC